jgi:hypothetical protein
MITSGGFDDEQSDVGGPQSINQGTDGLIGVVQREPLGRLIGMRGVVLSMVTPSDCSAHRDMHKTAAFRDRFVCRSVRR